MSNTIDYYLSLISPWSFLGHERLLAMAEQHGATVNIWPVDFSLVFSSTGGIPLPKRSEQRKAYRMQELRRWRDLLQIDFNLEPKYFPVSDKLAATMVVTLREQDPAAAIRLAGACLRACWVEERDISDRDTLLGIAAENDQDGERLLAGEQSALKTIQQDSERAVELGVFGAPSYRLNEHLFWGQDRLDFLERALEDNSARTA